MLGHPGALNVPGGQQRMAVINRELLAKKEDLLPSVCAGTVWRQRPATAQHQHADDDQVVVKMTKTGGNFT